MIDKTLNHYQISEKLGAGGMGAVYRARDQKLGRDVAIKVLPEEFAKDTDRVARFQREVNEMNKTFGQTEQIKRFRLVQEEWTPNTGELSPTLKLRRKYLYQRYEAVIQDIFSVQKGE